MSNQVQIEKSWKELLDVEFEKEYFQNIITFLKKEKAANKKILPPGKLIFNCFEQTPFDNVKVVLLGQDPYHGVGQAHGLCFSVAHGIAIPPSLKNMYNELQSDIKNFKIPQHGNLEYWAKQGILMLNATLTVEEQMANSHAKIGWQVFTDAVIKIISEKKQGIIFLLWGKFAQEKRHLIDSNKHHVLMAAHPSPFSVFQGFYGCKHFSKTNELLVLQAKEKIDWQV